MGGFSGLSSGNQTLIVSDDNGCTDQVTVAISNSDGPILDEVQIDAPNCFNGEDGSAYVLVQGGLPSYTYYQDGVEVTADVHNLSAGANQILVVDAQLCSLYVDFTVPAADSLVAVIDTNFVIGDLPLSVDADGLNSIGASTYQWELNDELIGSNSDVSEMIFEEGGYNLILTVFEGICSDTTSFSFNVENAYEWEIPNTFTPNGDGSNDNFRIRNSHNEFVNISIYNSWGELIYSFEGSNVNWDGRLKSGNFASAGIYFYILRYAETENSEVSEVNGYIRLVR
jgi:gliding motility-associated-like protein